MSRIIQVGDKVRWRNPGGPARTGVVRRTPGYPPLRYGQPDPLRSLGQPGRSVEVWTLVQNIPCPLYILPQTLKRRWFQ